MPGTAIMEKSPRFDQAAASDVMSKPSRFSRSFDMGLAGERDYLGR